MFMEVCIMCLTSPGSFISAIRYSGSPAGGSTSKVNSGLRDKKRERGMNDETRKRKKRNVPRQYREEFKTDKEKKKQE